MEKVFADNLGHESGVSYRVSRALAAAFPNHALVAIENTFDPEEFARVGRCTIAPRTSPHAELATSWRRNHGLGNGLRTGMYDVTYEGHSFVVAQARWLDGYQTASSWYVLGEDRAATERFVAVVCEYCNTPHDAVLVFRGGCWSTNQGMWREIQATSFDDLILAGDLAREIQDDLTSFLAAKEDYARYGVPWKRGVLLTGPAGNGKTHCLRATIKLLGVTCLYVQSFKAPYEPEDANIAKVFDRAREVTPCCLVFEDLDALVTNENRSAFLNQLDGFASASGMLTLATTNHPEKLDPAIVDRPSRFDRKYHFALPAEAERRRYIQRWQERLDADMRITTEQVESLSVDTDGFSFAYLKELFLSSMIRWMKTRHPGGMHDVALTQLRILREQMTTAPDPTPAAAAPDDFMAMMMKEMANR